MNIFLNKWGNSLGFRLPKHILKKYNLENGSALELLEQENGIFLKKAENISLSEIISSYKDEPLKEVFQSTLSSEDWDWEE